MGVKMRTVDDVRILGRIDGGTYIETRTISRRDPISLEVKKRQFVARRNRVQFDKFNFMIISLFVCVFALVFLYIIIENIKARIVLQH